MIKKLIITTIFLLWSIPAFATQQVILGRTNVANDPTATEYIPPMCGGGATTTCDLTSTRTTAEGIAPTGGTISKLAVEITTDPANGAGTQSWTINVWVAGSVTSVTCAISEGATTCQDSTNSASVSAGNAVTIEVVPANTPAANTGFRYSWVWTPTTADENIYMWAPGTVISANLNTGGNNRRTPPFGHSNWTVGDGDRLMAPGSFTVKKLYVRTEADPDNGAGVQSFTFTIRENGSDGAITCAISDGATTCNDTSNTIAAVAGDSYAVNHISANTPGANNRAAGGIVLLAGTSGQFVVPAVFPVNSTTSVYGSMHSGSNNATESARDALASLGFTVLDMYVLLSAATDADGDVTFTMREELGTPATSISCNVPLASTTCNNSTDVTITALNTYDTLSAPNLTPGTPTASIGYLGFITPPSATRRVIMVQ